MEYKHEVTETITYRNTDGEQIEFSSKPPFVFSQKTGFETPENEINFIKNYQRAGGTFVGARLDVRDIEVDGIILADSKKELASSRREMISVFNPALAGTLTYENELGSYEIDVIPETAPLMNESSFVDHKKTDEFTILLKALDPFWRDKSDIKEPVPLARTQALFEFPLNIVDGFEFARFISGEVVQLENAGDVPVGFVLTVNVNGLVINPKIYNVLTQEFFEVTGVFTSGTVVRLSTVSGEKKIEIDKGDGFENAMSSRASGSSFFELDKGTNYVQMQASRGIELTLSSIEFLPKVLGV